MTPATGDKAPPVRCLLPVMKSSTRDDPDTGAAEVIPVKIPGTGDA